MVLSAQWPTDLDPSRVGFRQRTETVLRRQGLWSDMALLDEVTESDTAEWWYAGDRTLIDLTVTGNAALEWHHNQSRTLAQWAQEEWTNQIWARDPRFTDLLPPTNTTIREICQHGSHADQRFLWKNFSALRARMLILSTENPDTALRRYVEGLSSQTDDRLVVIMRVNGLADPAMRGVDAAELLGVSAQRVSQLADRMRELVVWATPPGGVWMPQTAAAERLKRVPIR